MKLHNRALMKHAISSRWALMNNMLSAVDRALMNYLLSAADGALSNYLLSVVDKPLLNYLPSTVNRHQLIYYLLSILALMNYTLSTVDAKVRGIDEILLSTNLLFDLTN